MPKDLDDRFEQAMPHPVRKRLRKMGKLIQGAGGGKAGGGGQEADNTLRTRQIVRTLELLCEGPVKSISAPYLNKTILVGENGELAFKGVTYQTRLGLPDQPPVEDMEDQTSETSLDILVRVAAPGTFTVTDPDTDAVKVTVRLPSLWRLDDSGNMQPTNLSYRVQYRPSGAPAWIDAMGSPYSLEQEKCTSNVYLDHRVILTGAAPWSVRVVRVTVDNELDAKLQNDLYLSGYSEIINQKFSYPNSALMAIRADAEQFGNRVPERAAFVEGMICEVPVNYDTITRTYTGLWNGLFKQEWTDDPAWCLRNMVKNKRFGMARYVRAEFLSDPMLYGISQYCSQYVSNGVGGTEPRFSFNAVIASQQEAYDVLNAMVSAFRGMIYWAAGTAMIVQDSPREPSMLVTKANVIGGKFTRRGADLKTQHNRVNVSYNNPDKFYERDIVPVDDPGDHIARFGLKPTDIVAFACSSVSQAMRAGRWLMYTERMEGEILTYIGGQDHHDVQPGDVHRVIDPGEIGMDFGGRVAAYTTTTITLDRPVTLELGVQYQLTVHDNTANRALHDRTLTGTGEPQTTFTVSVALPPMTTNPFETVWAIRKSVGQDTLWSVLACREVGPMQYEITALRHDPAKYALIENDLDIPDFPAPLLATGALGMPSDLGLVMSLESAPGSARTALASLTFRPTNDSRVVGYELHYRLEAGAWAVVNLGRTTNYEMRGLSQGTRYTYRVRGYDGVGQYSQFSNAAVATAESFSSTLANPTPVSVTGDIKALVVKWVNPVATEFDATEVWYASTYDLFAAVRAGESSGNTFTIPALDALATYHTWVRARGYGAPPVYSGFVYMGGQATKAVEVGDISTAFEDLLNDLEAGSILNYSTLPATGLLNQIILKTPEMVLYRWDGTAWTTTLYTAIQPGSVGIASFAAGLEPVGISTAGSLPTVKTTNALTWSGKLYRWNGTAYVASVPTTDLAGTLTSAQIGTGSVLEANLAANAVTVAKIAAGAVEAGAIAAGAVTASKIADATLTTAKFAAGLEPVGISTAGSLPTTKTTTALVWQNSLYRWNGTAYVKTVPTSDLAGTIAEANLASIAASKVTGQLTDTQIADLDAAKLAGTLSPNRIGTGAILSAKLADAAITTAKLADGALSLAKFATGLEPVGISTAGSLPTVKTTEALFWQNNLYRWSGSAYVKSVAAGDISGTIADANLAGIAASKITGQLTDSQIADLDAAKLAGTLSMARISAGAILAGKIADAAITNAKIADAAVSVAKFASGLTPVEIVSSLPTSGNFAGRTVFLSSNSKLYRHTGSPSGSGGYTVATDGADIVANSITAGQISAGAITATEIATGAIIAAKLAANSVTAAAILAGTITATQIAANAITATQIQAGTITASELAANSVTAGKILAGAITTAKIAANAVTANEIAAATITATEISAGAITTAKLAAGSVTALTIAANTITAAQIAAGTITASELAANSIVAGKIAAGAITATEIAAGSIVASKLIVSDNSNIFPDFDMLDDAFYTSATSSIISFANSNAANTGRRTISLPAAGATSLESGWFPVDPSTDYRALASAWLSSAVAGAGTSTASVEFGSVTGAGVVTPTTKTTIVSRTDNASLAQVSVNLVSGASDKRARFVLNSSGGTQIPRAGGFRLQKRANGALIVDGAITALQIAANTITATNILAGTITATELATNSITAIKITAGSITTAKIATNAVTANEIAAGTITATEISSGAITTAKLAVGAVTAGTIAANAVTAAAILAGTITATELAANSITTAKIQAGAITATEIAAGAILASKIVVADSSNLYPDFDMQDAAFYTSPNGAVISLLTTGSGNLGKRFLQIDNNAALRTAQTAWFPLDITTEYLVTASAFMQSAAAGAGTSTVSFETGSVDAAGAITVTSTTTVASRTDVGTTAGLSVSVTTNSASRVGRFVITRAAGGTSGGRAGAFKVQKKATGELIVDGAITAAKITAGTITAAQIAAGTITATEIAASTITAAKIAAGTITANQIAAGTITATQLAADSVTTVKILAGSITAGTIATDAITSDKILANSITTAKIAAGAVTATEIAANAIVASKVLISDFANIYPDFNMMDPAFYSTPNTASYTFSGTGASGLGERLLSISVNAASKTVNSNWFTIEPGVEYSATASAWLSTAAAGQGTMTVALETASLDNAGVLTSLGSTTVVSRTDLAYSGGAAATVTIVAGSTARRARFVMTRAAGGAGIGSAAGLKLQKKGTGALLVDGTITANHIAAGTITASQIAAGTITATQIAAGAVTAVKIAAGTITTDKLAVTGMALVGGVLQSSDFVTGVSGWQVTNAGAAEFNSLIVREEMIVSGAVSRQAANYGQTFFVEGFNTVTTPQILITVAYTPRTYIFTPGPFGRTINPTVTLITGTVRTYDAYSSTMILGLYRRPLTGGSWTYTIGNQIHAPAEGPGFFSISHVDQQGDLYIQSPDYEYAIGAYSSSGWPVRIDDLTINLTQVNK